MFDKQEMTDNNITHFRRHLNEHESPYNTGSPPIFQSSIFSFDTFNDFSSAISEEDHHLL